MNAQRRPAPKRIASSISATVATSSCDEPQRLAPQRLEQPVGDEAVDLAAQDERAHADRAVDAAGALARLARAPPQISTSGSR